MNKDLFAFLVIFGICFLLFISTFAFNQLYEKFSLGYELGCGTYKYTKLDKFIGYKQARELGCYMSQRE
jgi:hypothetical protein